MSRCSAPYFSSEFNFLQIFRSSATSKKIKYEEVRSTVIFVENNIKNSRKVRSTDIFYQNEKIICHECTNDIFSQIESCCECTNGIFNSYNTKNHKEPHKVSQRIILKMSRCLAPYYSSEFNFLQIFRSSATSKKIKYEEVRSTVIFVENNIKNSRKVRSTDIFYQNEKIICHECTNDIFSQIESCCECTNGIF